MFDLRFHAQINHMLRFTPPPKRLPKSVGQMRAIQQQRKRVLLAHHNEILIDMDDVEALHAYVTEEYFPYFGLDPSAHRLEWTEGHVYMG